MNHMPISYNGCLCDSCHKKLLEAYQEAKFKWDQGERNIVFQDYKNECSDGCCSEWGTNVYVNKFPLNCDGRSVDSAVEALLEFLGYENVNIDFESEE